MIAYIFRTIDHDDGLPTGYIGMAFAANKRDLFWEIDQYCDPYGIEIKTAHEGSFCLLQGNGELDEENTKYETTESLPGIEEPGWRKPNWEGVLEN